MEYNQWQQAADAAMKKNDFLCINSLIYQIYNEPDFLAMRNRVLELVQTLIPCAFASFMTVSRNEAGLSLTDPVGRPEELAVERVYMTMQEQDYSRWLMFGSRSQVIRASDLLSEHERVQTPYYQKCCAPFGLHYILDAALVMQGESLGVLSLYREKKQGDFTAEEIFLLQALSDHLAARFFRERCGAKETGIENRPTLAAFCEARHLTRREVQVLTALLQGDDTASISQRLCISANTLKKHQQSIYRKCNVSSRPGLDALCRGLARE